MKDWDCTNKLKKGKQLILILSKSESTLLERAFTTATVSHVKACWENIWPNSSHIYNTIKITESFSFNSQQHEEAK